MTVCDTDNLNDIKLKVDKVFPNALDHKIISWTSYGSMLGIPRFCCCCVEMVSKLGRHVFVEAKTSGNLTWTFEKVRDHIIVQVSRTGPAKPTVRTHQNGKMRVQREKSIEDSNPKECLVKDVLQWIIERELPIKYHVVESNCVFFVEKSFKK